MDRLKEKIAIVTGGTQGIGKGIAKCFVNEGAKVVITSPTEEKGKKAASELGKNVIYIKQDVSNEDDWETVISQTLSQFGGLDIVVNNAGIAPQLVSIDKETLEDWNKVINVDLTGTFLGVKHGMATMAKNGGGSIINISSIEGLIGAPTVGPYNAAKGGVRLLTKSAALDATTNKYNVRVNSVHPGYIDTDIIPEDQKAMYGKLTPMGHIGKPEDIGMLCVYLASDESKFVTGSEFVIDGGVTAQ
ncbi:glucose 1-dehydrogenase [Limosilactobacillus sp.]|uniref:glucose 1-dehydrogenase n=1 Tax=Limosilactobacillus sp. TaxID=2773925 RepID=UPI0025C58D69|nr:glucose 1-dehydrogenase [Limosilactobacillus sp.]MCI2031723.1 glucose 1-dehydrogenase [Limosilactobacillus sp.]